jgi:hypothetical protein
VGVCYVDLSAALADKGVGHPPPEWSSLLPVVPARRSATAATARANLSLRPEIKVSLHLSATRITMPSHVEQQQQQQAQQQQQQQQQLPPTPVGLPSSLTSHVKQPRPVPSVQIGTGTEHFDLAVSMVSLSGLTGLRHFSPNLSRGPPVHRVRPQTDLYFYFSIFGRDVMTAPVLASRFLTLQGVVDIPGNCSLFHIQSSVPDLRAYLENESPLKVYVCSADEVVGVAEIDVSTLVSRDKARTIDKAVEVAHVVTQGAGPRSRPAAAERAPAGAGPPPLLRLSVSLERVPAPGLARYAAGFVEVQVPSVLLYQCGEVLARFGEGARAALQCRLGDCPLYRSEPLEIRRSEADTCAWLVDEVFRVDLAPLQEAGHDLASYLEHQHLVLEMCVEPDERAADPEANPGAVQVLGTLAVPLRGVRPVGRRLLLEISDTMHFHDPDGGLIAEALVEITIRERDEPADLEDARAPAQHQQQQQQQQQASSHPPVDETLPRKWRLSLDLRSVRDVPDRLVHVFLRYLHPLLSGARAVITQPAVEVVRGREALVSNGSASFVLQGPLGKIKTDLALAAPVEVQVWRKEKYQKDELYGTASVALASLFERPDRAPKGGAKVLATVDTYAPIVTAGSVVVGELRAIMTLDDIGPADPHHPSSSSSTEAAGNKNNNDTTYAGASFEEPSDASRLFSHDHHGEGDEVAREPAAPSEAEVRKLLSLERGRLDMLLAMAHDLEKWKHEERARIERDRAAHEQELKEKERARLEALDREFKKREAARSSALEKRVGDYNRLEAHAQRLLSDLERRERKLVMAEEEIRKHAERIGAEADRRIADADAGTRRAQEDFIHQVALEKKRFAELDKQFRQTLARLNVSEEKGAALLEENARLRLQLTEGPNPRLAAEAAHLKVQLAEAERRADQARHEHKASLDTSARYARELALLKQKFEEESRARLLRDQRQLEHLRLQYLAREEDRSLRAESQLIQGMKEEIKELARPKAEQPRRDQAGAEARDEDDIKRGRPDIVLSRWEQKAGVEKEVQRLCRERRDLLQSGLYNPDAEIIKELDARINALGGDV